MNPGGRSTKEWLILATLAVVQFTVAVDYVIIMPLGPQLRFEFLVDIRAFNLAVSAYAGAAALSGVGAAFVLDRFDRKRVLLAIYAGFVVATLLCAIAPNYAMLVSARAAAGCFGGVLGGNSLAIIGDLIPDARRASAVGAVMSAVPIAQIVGVPIGLCFSDRFGWHAPFLLLSALSGIVWILAMVRLPRVRTHLDDVEKPRSFVTAANGNHVRALMLTAVITLGGSMIIPDLANYLASNVHLSTGSLAWVYLFGGSGAFLAMNGCGRLADRFGRLAMFRIMMGCSIIAAFLVTNLPVVPPTLAVAAVMFFMMSMTGRLVPAMAMITGSVESKHRGGFMSINAAVQQGCVALAATITGLIVHDGPHHELMGFGLVGWAYLCWAIIGLWMASGLRSGVLPGRAKLEVVP